MKTKWKCRTYPREKPRTNSWKRKEGTNRFLQNSWKSPEQRNYWARNCQLMEKWKMERKFFYLNPTLSDGSSVGDGLSSYIADTPNESWADHLGLHRVCSQGVLVPFPQSQHVCVRIKRARERERDSREREKELERESTLLWGGLKLWNWIFGWLFFLLFSFLYFFPWSNGWQRQTFLCL